MYPHVCDLIERVLLLSLSLSLPPRQFLSRSRGFCELGVETPIVATFLCSTFSLLLTPGVSSAAMTKTKMAVSGGLRSQVGSA